MQRIALKVLSAGVAFVAILCATPPAFTQHGGHMGGSFHGGGFHGGGFHGGGFHSGGFHGGGFHGGSFHGGVNHFHGGFWGHPSFGFGIGIGIGVPGAFWAPYPYPYYGYAPYYPPYYYPPYPYAYPYPYPYPPPYPYPYYRYYPVTGPDGYNGSGSGENRDDGSSAAQPYAKEGSDDQAAQYQALDSELQQLPPDRRRVVENVIRALRAMPPDARQRHIDSGRYKNLSPKEQELVAWAVQLAAAPAQTRESVPQPSQ